MALNIDLDGEFPGARRATYLDTAARSLLPASSRAAALAMLDHRMQGTANKDMMFATVERTRAAFAKLIGAEADEIAITKNISEGVNIVASSLPIGAGDNVIVCPDVEHPANIYPWYNLTRRLGVEVRAVPARDGQIDAQAFTAALDRRTRAVALSIISFSPGLRADLTAIADACRTHDVFLFVDGAQSVGILHTDVEALGIDGLAVSTQKGLLGPYGMGFLYVRQNWAERMMPVYLSRFGVDLGRTHEAARGGADAPLMAGARRFDVGNYNYEAAVIADRSLALLASIGTEAIERHVVGLAHALAERLYALGLPVAGGRPGPHLGPIVCVGRHGAGGHDSTEDVAMASLHRAVVEADVSMSVRQGMLRFSFHLFNTERDVERVVGVARAWIEQSNARPRTSSAG